MQGQEFITDLRLLKLAGCDIVLGVDSMRTVSPIIFDFKKLEVTFEKDGKRLTLIGSLDMGACKLISGKKLQKFFKTTKTQMAQMFSIYAVETGQLEEAEFLEHWTPWTAYSNVIQTLPEV